LAKWTFPDLAMFCLFCARATNTLSIEALHEMLRISDTDFIKQCNPKVRASLLSTWFDSHICIKLETLRAPGP
jgi:hypothetical protein